jgi:SAM-dependent methyltransferase
MRGNRNLLSSQERKVGAYYDKRIFDAELQRLPHDSPVEFAMTCRMLDRLTPEGAIVAEVGVGGGHYTELLARRGCRLALVDVSERLLDSVVARLRSAGLERQVHSVRRESGTGLSLNDGSVDVVLLMGPLYHLHDAEDRSLALQEALRVLCPRGLVFAAGVNRLAYPRDLFRKLVGSPSSGLPKVQEYLRDGNLTPDEAPPIGYAHLSSPDEFRALCTRWFEEIDFIGVESFAAPFQQMLNSWGDGEAELWLEAIDQTCRTPEGIAYSDHFLFVGCKRP